MNVKILTFGLFSYFYLSESKTNPVRFMKFSFIFIAIALLISVLTAANAQEEIKTISVDANQQYQSITGFGASLAYYEGWLTAHPNRSEIYDVIFSELSLDILRIRNAYGYDDGMIGRVQQFAAAAEKSLGHPIDILVTSWSPPGYLKSNNDRNNGGTLKFSISNGKVNFDYAGFANWWNESLDNYNSNGIYPKYISIQNEPDWSASYESCLLRPSEVVSASDTIAGYNKALVAVYDTVMQRENPPVFLGPECIGIGYNAVENYVNALDLSKLHGIAHHLYHGAEGGSVQDDPFTSANYKKVGNFHPEVPHFQTEYSRGDWFSLAAMMHQSLAVENVTAFLYWDLVWPNSGLVSIDFPWDRSQWTNSKGFYRTKDFYVFKHYSAFIQPGWKRIGTSSGTELIKTAAFISSSGDSASFVAINRSAIDTFKLRLQLTGYKINEATAYSTTEDKDFEAADYLTDTVLTLAPKSINTIDLRISKRSTSLGDVLFTQNSRLQVSCFPNPFDVSTQFTIFSEENGGYSLALFDLSGRKVAAQEMGFYPPGNHCFTFRRNDLKPGIYTYQIKSTSGKTGQGKFIIVE